MAVFEALFEGDGISHSTGIKVKNHEVFCHKSPRTHAGNIDILNFIEEFVIIVLEE